MNLESPDPDCDLDVDGDGVGACSEVCVGTDSFNYTDMASASALLTLNGSAAIVGDRLRITPTLDFQTGSAWHAEHRFAPRRYEATVAGWWPPREVLYARIAERARAMLAAGWEDEVRGLLARGVPPDAPPLQALGYRDVVKVTVFLRDLDHYQAMNAIYAEYFSEVKPARAAVQVARLPKDVDIEIECVAHAAR